MTAAVRFQTVHAGIDLLLKSSGLASEVERVANEIKGRAEQRNVLVNQQTEPMPYEVIVGVAGDRVGALVIAAHPAGLAAEAKYGTLAGSL